MLTFGEKIDMSDFAPIKLVQISEAQSYLHPIAKSVCSSANMNAYLVDDGENQTSDLFIDEAEELLSKTQDLKDSTFFKIIEKLAASGNGIVIWWANNDLLEYQNAYKCTNLEMLLECATEQLRSNRTIQVFLPASPSFMRDA